jgi:hypothetical protein
LKALGVDKRFLEKNVPWRFSMSTKAQTRENGLWLDSAEDIFITGRNKRLGQIPKTGSVASFPGKEWLSICPRLFQRPSEQEEPFEVILFRTLF